MEIEKLFYGRLQFFPLTQNDLNGDSVEKKREKRWTRTILLQDFRRSYTKIVIFVHFTAIPSSFLSFFGFIILYWLNVVVELLARSGGVDPQLCI